MRSVSSSTPRQRLRHISSQRTVPGNREAANQNLPLFQSQRLFVDSKAHSPATQEPRCKLVTGSNRNYVERPRVLPAASTRPRAKPTGKTCSNAGFRYLPSAQPQQKKAPDSRWVGFFECLFRHEFRSPHSIATPVPAFRRDPPLERQNATLGSPARRPAR